MSFATLDGHRVTGADLVIPYFGAWWGSVDLDGETAAEFEGEVSLAVGGLTLIGEIRRGGEFQGQPRWRVDGAPGWGKDLPARGYQSDTGVKLSWVLTDAAREAGETIASGYTDRVLGAHFARGRSVGAVLLTQLLGPNGWHVANDGVTTIGEREGGDVVVEHDLISYAPEERIAVVATEAPEGFAPGKTIAIAGTSHVISTMRLDLTSGQFRVHLWLDPQPRGDRFAEAVWRVVSQRLPQLPYLGVKAYRVVGQSGNLLDLEAAPSLGLPSLKKVPIAPGVPGMSVEPANGARVLVVFVNADPGRPVIVGYESPDGGAFVPANVTIDGDGIDLGEALAEVLRNGETVDITGTFPPAGPGTMAAATITLNPATFGGSPSKVQA